MIDSSQDAVFNLRKTDDKNINKNVSALLIEQEKVLGVYVTVRDQVVFTNMRIITIDVQGITGVKQDITSFPYSRIQYYAVQTAGLLELIPDCELALYFNNGFRAIFEFKGSCDILEIGKAISRYALTNF